MNESYEKVIAAAQAFSLKRKKNSQYVISDNETRRETVMGNSENMKTDGMPLVSVCIPTYNGSKTIKDTIASVLSQTYSNIEIIVCDDQSTDDTVDVVKSIDDERITVQINPQNLGLVGNMNRCVNVANGKYVKVLCQDDILRPQMIERQVRVFQENEGVSIVTCGSTVIDNNNKVINKRKVYKKDTRIDGLKYAKKSLNGRNIFGEPSLQMYDTAKAKQTDLYAHTEMFYSIDWDAGIKMSYLGDVYYISEDLASFQISKNSASSKLSKEKDPRLISSLVFMYDYHKKLGKIRLGGFHELKFKIMIRLYAIARNMIIGKANR